ncbi:acyl-CoA synthetase [Pseudomaricurvus alkylphenolicus]|uniref:acyl-CoA synthetase n=1 Tax=Pseudomaricurvus alkylphenolicus TaxID=1306991 RepID=UPI0014220B2D|nr:acyl-CoA synthetase [Pseudomaricurvus alkylphenolicus]NIB42891.1 acyl-CoA synthetase [Pseudomaricurvus alkylphenolicus]
MNPYIPSDFKMTGLDALQTLEATPLGERGLPASTYQLLSEAAERHGDKIALRFLLQGLADEDGITYSYREFLQRITQTANAFHQLGINSDDTVAMLLPNLPQAYFTIWGAEAAGIFNPINPLLEVEHIAAILNEVHCPVLVTLAPMAGTELWAKAQQIKARVPSLKTIVAVDLANFLGDDMKALVTADREDYLNDNVLDFDQLIGGQNSDGLDSGRIIDSEDIASYFHTGGTTGTPKLAPHTHANEVASTFQINTATSMNGDIVTLVGLPLFHVNAVFTGLSTWLGGGELLLATPQGYRTPALMENFWAIVEKHRVGVFSAVPTILSGLLNFPTEDYDLSSLQFAICGAAPLATELARQFEDQTGLVLLEGYGQTEGTCASTISPRFGDRRIGSVGVNLPYLQVRIVEVDEKTGLAVRDCDTNEAGVIAIKGPNVFKGYKQKHQNQGQWVDDGWFNTGDLGRLDADGYLSLTGRSKDLIIRGGHNIDPQMIEEALFEHDAVADVAAIGKPDARVGELPIAYIQLKPGATATVEELLAFAAEHISERAAVPKEIHIVDAMPLTAVGKIFKPDLRNDTVETLVKEEMAKLGLEIAELSVEVDKKYGQFVKLKVANNADQTQASECLGQFAFKTEISA